jgi:GNAT superfamily N-acetyltransferase
MTAFALRPATMDDAAFATDVYTAVRPGSPMDPVLERYAWEHEPTNFIVRRFVVADADVAVGVAAFEHPRWELAPERVANVRGELLPARRTAEGLGALFAAVEERAIADGARVLRGFADEGDDRRAQVLRGRGYREDRRSRRLELDLSAQRERIMRMTAESRERMRREGVRMLTLAEEPGAGKYERIWRLSEEAGQDVPTTFARTPDALEDYLAWFRSPDIREDRFWIAKTNDEIVGVSVLGYPPVRGVVGTHWTATARSVRGRGVARALKCETLMQAIALGIDRVRTGNDAANAPILHINETMGYRPIAGSVHFVKRV